MATTIVILALACLNNPTQAGIIQVPEDQLSIAAGLAAASYGDTVSIAAGTYYEHDLVLPPGVSIHGRGGSPESVVIDAQWQGRVLGGVDLVVENEIAFLTLRNGDATGWEGGGLMIKGDAYFHNCIVEYCRGATYGVGLYVSGGATITDCILRHNQTDAPDTSGGGAWLNDRGPSRPIYASNLEVYGNRAASGAGIYYNSYHGYLTDLHVYNNDGNGMVVVNGEVDGIGPTIENSLFEGNTFPGLAFDAGLVLRNCTIVGNGLVGSQVGGIYCGSTWDHPMHFYISQCLIAFNNGPGITLYYPTPFTIECNDVFGNKGYNYLGLPDLTGQDGNISLDPRFCGRGSSLYGLQSNSPCAPVGNDCGLLMGAFPVSCEGTSTAQTSWSALKAIY